MAHNEMYSHIEKLVKFHLVKYYYEKQGCDLIVDEFLPYCATLIFPCIELKIDDGGEQKSVMPIVDSLRKIKNIQELKEYTFEGLNQILKKEWLHNIDLKSRKDLLSGISLVNSIQEDGIFTIKNNEKVLQQIIKNYNLELGQYGNKTIQQNTPEIIAETEEYSLDDVNNTNNDLEAIEGEMSDKASIKKDDQRSISTTITETEQENKLNEFWTKKIYGGDYETHMPYVWKLRISNEIYVELKCLLKECFINLKIPKECDKFIKKHHEKLVVYAAEWFKWEFQTGCNNNAFTDLDVKNISSKVWDNLNKWKTLRYKGNFNDIHLYSIYALGGLPLMAIKNSGKIDNLFEKLLHKEEDIDTIIKSLDNVISGNSDAFRQSLADTEQGSWSKFIQAMCDNPDLLYANIDKENNELVQYFYERLENGRRKSIEEEIKWNWIFYTTPDCEEISGDIIVNIGEDNRNGCVAAEIVNSDERELYLGIECQNEIVNYRKYSKTNDQKRFVGWGTTSNRISGYIEDLSQPIRLCKYKVDQLQPAAGEVIAPKKELGSKFIEVYATNDGSGWTTLRDFSKKDVKAVLFPSDDYDIEGNTLQIQNKVIGGKAWSLCEITEVVQLKDKETGNTYNLYQEGKISVKLPSKTDTIKYYDSSKFLVKCYINGQEQFLPLMLDKPNGRCVIVHSKQNEKILKPIRLKDIAKVEYTQNHSRNDFLKTSPKTGIITLDINEYKYKKRYVYLPKEAIKRDLSNGTIIFGILSDVTKIEFISADGSAELLVDNVYKDINIAQLKTDDVIEDTILFRIYFSDEDYVELEIYRPINCRELKLGNRLIKRYNDNNIQSEERIKLPYILRDQFGLKVFDEGGVRTISNFKDFRWFISDDTIHECDEFDIYLYIDRQINNEPIGELDIGSKGWEQYKFYYWSVETNTQPQLVKTSYDYDKGRLIVSTEMLKDNNGIIFQSLKDCLPRHYLRAFNGEACRTSSLELRFKCFKIAVLHKVPFAQFYPLQHVVGDIDSLQDFYKLVINDCSRSKKDIYKDLHRFANEFGFEWILLPRSFWRRQSIDKNQAMIFMQQSNFIETSCDKQRFGNILNIYLNAKPTEFNRIDIRGRTAELVKDIIKYMRGDNQMISASNRNIEVIKKLYESNNWILDLLRKFENN